LVPFVAAKYLPQMLLIETTEYFSLLVLEDTSFK
jgi:hypothetical protein